MQMRIFVSDFVDIFNIIIQNNKYSSEPINRHLKVLVEYYHFDNQSNLLLKINNPLTQKFK